MSTHQIKVNPGDTITISVEPCSKPAPLQLREGAWYELKTGARGACHPNPQSDTHPWMILGNWYTDAGRFSTFLDPSKLDVAKEVPPPQPDTVTSEMLALQAKVARYEAAINWACGRAVYDDFSPPEDAKKKPYWWRGGLTKRAKLRYDCARQKYVSQDDAPQPDTVDVEKLIELVQLIRKRNISGWINRFTLDKDLAALHPRLKQEVER